MKAVFTGDLAFSEIHMWLAENRPDAWLENIAAIKALGPIELVYPGHGNRNDPGVLDDTASYIRDFQASAELASTSIDIIADMKSKYPELMLIDVLNYSAYGVMGEKMPTPAENIGELVSGFKQN
jgi:glyoxylase-like metal-dependent hydrolase (beta-lactamase superfamily II)